MSFLEERDRQTVQDRLKELPSPVRLVNFTQELECQYCRETRNLLSELVELSDQLSLEVYNFQIDKAKVEQYRVDKIPATVIEGTKDYGIRYYGIPAGYEFASLLEDIMDVSRGTSGLSAKSKERIQVVTAPLHIQVFVTPTCPYCPSAVRMAHQLAIENDRITADMVEATEFPHLAVKYSVRGVPKTVVNEETHMEGSLPEAAFVDGVLSALDREADA